MSHALAVAPVRSHAGLVVEGRHLVPQELRLVSQLLVVELEALHLCSRRFRSGWVR